MASAAARERYARKNEAEDLRRAFAFLDRKGDGRVDAAELAETFAVLGYKPRRGEVDDMIWEADEDCDGAVDWAEFVATYRRCREDAAGTEPRGLFDVIEFVMRDKEGTGSISLEDAMAITYLRHGRAQLDAKLEEVFGTSDLNSGLALGLGEFLGALHAHQVRGLLARAAAARGGSTGGTGRMTSGSGGAATGTLGGGTRVGG